MSQGLFAEKKGSLLASELQACGHTGGCIYAAFAGSRYIFPERSYMIEMIFAHLWKMPYKTETWALNYTRLSVTDDERQCELILEDGLFGCSVSEWLRADSLLVVLLPVWDLDSTPLTGILSDPLLPVV